MSTAVKPNTPDIIDTALTAEPLSFRRRVPYQDLMRMARFAANNATLEMHQEIDGLVLSLHTYLLRSTHQNTHVHTYKVPANWWEQLKEEHAPAWFNKRFPVRYADRSFTYEKYTNLCPHADFAWDKSPIHLQYMQGLSPKGVPAPEEFQDLDWVVKLRQAVNAVSPAYETMDLREAVLLALKRFRRITFEPSVCKGDPQ